MLNPGEVVTAYPRVVKMWATGGLMWAEWCRDPLTLIAAGDLLDKIDDPPS